MFRRPHTVFSMKLTSWVLNALRRVRTTGWEYHISKHDSGHPTPENPLREFSLLSAVTLSSRRITLIRLDGYIGVPGSTALDWYNHVLPQIEVLAAELVQQGFISRSRVTP